MRNKIEAIAVVAKVRDAHYNEGSFHIALTEAESNQVIAFISALKNGTIKLLETPAFGLSVCGFWANGYENIGGRLKDSNETAEAEEAAVEAHIRNKSKKD